MGWILDRLRRFFGSTKSFLVGVPGVDYVIDDKPVYAEGDPVWCAVANVLIDRPHGVEKEIRHGTKQFAPGAKVYVYDFYWGMGGERVKVLGQPRKGRRFINLAMPAKHLANWRAELVYHPYVAEKVRELNPQSEKRVRGSVASYIANGAVTQPFTARVSPRDSPPDPSA